MNGRHEGNVWRRFTCIVLGACGKGVMQARKRPVYCTWASCGNPNLTNLQILQRPLQADRQGILKGVKNE
jgi:hypothetical protein